MIKIKIHNVLHDRHDETISELENGMAEYVGTGQSVDVSDVRIASGPQNSPIYITLDESDISLQKAKSISRVAISYFSRYVDGVNIDDAVRNRNIRVVNR